DPRLGRDLLGNLVSVLHCGQAGADIEELTYPGLTSQKTHDADEELPGLLSPGDDVRVHRDEGVTGGAVDLVVVFAAHPVVPDPRRMRHIKPDLRGELGAQFPGPLISHGEAPRVRGRREKTAGKIVHLDLFARIHAARLAFDRATYVALRNRTIMRDRPHSGV